MFQVTLNSSRTGLRILMNRTVSIDINSLDENGTSYHGMDLRMNDDAVVILEKKPFPTSPEAMSALLSIWQAEIQRK